MSTRTKTPSRTRTESAIVLDPEEFEAPGLQLGARSAGGERSEPDERAERAGGGAQRGAGGTRRASSAGGGRGELAPELIDEAVDRAAGRRRLRQALGVPADREISDELIDELLAGASTEEEIAGPGGLLAQLTKRLVERAMEAELTDELGYEPHCEPEGGAGNTRNGGTPKTLLTDHGPVRIRTPRDRNGEFEPQIVRKGQRRFVGFDDKILALYSRGLSVRDIRAHVAEIYGVEVGLDLISRVTDAVMDDVREWGKRPLEDIYPVVFLDCMVLKIREGGTVQRRALYLALGVTLEGDRDVLGMWFQETEGAKFWMQVLTDLKTRGVRDILICCVDGLTGFPEAIEAIFPQTTVQTCIVHLIRSSLKYVPRREREQVARDLKPIYTAKDADQAHAELEAFDEKWGQRFPVITQAWLTAWEHVIPFLAFPDEVRRVIYTTDESVKWGRLVSRSRGACGGARMAARGGRSAAGMPAKSGQDGWRYGCGRAGASPLRGAFRGVVVGVRLWSGRGRPRSEAQVLGLRPAAQLAL
jgi:putative transposase